MKRTNSISLFLSPLLTALLACGGGGSRSSYTPDPLERDVYRSADECLKDWNTKELCERMSPDDERAYQQSNGVDYPVYWGPHYYPRDRTVIYQGRTITPPTRSTTIPSYRVTSSSSPASRSSVSTPRSTSGSSTRSTSSSSSPRTGGFGGSSPSSSGS